ncbi:MAG: diguanylate cyclase, partial [Pusillimonas sp.]
LVSPDRRIVDANARFASLFLQPGQNPKDLDLRQIHLDEDHWEGLGISYMALRDAGHLHLEYPFKDVNGHVRWFDIHAVLQDPEDPQSNIIWTWIDITSRHEADAALVLETLRLNTLLECFPGGVLIEDADEMVVFANPLWTRLLDIETPASALQNMHDIELRERLGPTISGWLRSHQPGRSPESRRSHEVRTPQGRHLEIDHIEIRQHKQYLGSVWLLRDITDRKQHELDLVRLASTDTLTALPNRRSFLQHLNAACATVVPSLPGIVMMLDIDHFKKVNDTYGHAIGDVVLQQVARTIRATLRADDVPGRLGGEEFAVLLPATDLPEGMEIAERIRHNVAQSTITADPHQIHVTISIGVARIASDTSPDDVLQHADDAMYTAKESGRNRVCAWTAPETVQCEPATT